jgi:hypothetical protein
MVGISVCTPVGPHIHHNIFMSCISQSVIIRLFVVPYGNIKVTKCIFYFFWEGDVVLPIAMFNALANPINFSLSSLLSHAVHSSQQ